VIDDERDEVEGTPQDEQPVEDAPQGDAPAEQPATEEPAAAEAAEPVAEETVAFTPPGLSCSSAICCGLPETDHTRTLPSAPAVARRWPSLLKLMS